MREIKNAVGYIKQQQKSVHTFSTLSPVCQYFVMETTLPNLLFCCCRFRDFLIGW
jgi:hypothetical protein